MKNKKIYTIIGLFVFVALVGGVSYSFFVYNKDIANISLSTGSISIDLSNINGNLNLTNLLPQSDTEGSSSTNYLDFTVTSTVDSEKIYYEVYILPKAGNTLDTHYLKTYLTDQNNNELSSIVPYYYLPDSTISGGKAIYRGLTALNNDYSTRNESKNFRLRLWLEEFFPSSVTKTFDFDVYLYARNVPEDYVVSNWSYCANCNYQALLVGIDNVETQFNNCDNVQCALVRIDQMLH